MRLIALGSPRAFTRRDGTPGEMVEAVIGNEEGVFRLVVWAPAILEGFRAGETVVIRGAAVKDGEKGIEYSLGEAGSITRTEREIVVPLDTIADVEEGGAYSLSGTVVQVQPARSFVTRSGRQSLVRNLVIADRTGEIPVVIWGEKAEEHLAVGDTLEVYNVSARKGRYGDLEVHVSWGSALVILAKEEVEVEVEGTIIPTRQGTALETADACYLLAEPLPVGYLVRARGTVYRGVIQISHLESITPDRDALQSRLDRLNEKP